MTGKTVPPVRAVLDGVNGASRMSARELKLEIQDAEKTMREEFI